MRNKIALLCTNFWRTERILPAVERLSKTHDIIVSSLGGGNVLNHHEDKHAIAVREKIKAKASDPSFEIHSNSVINRNGTSTWYEADIAEALANLDLDNLDCVIYDDSRTAGHQIPKIIFEPFYQILKERNIPVIANIHGNVDDERLSKFAAIEQGKIYDKLFVYGSYDRNRLAKHNIKEHVVEAGIPANDKIKNMPTSPEHVLIVFNRVQFKGMETRVETLENLQIQELWDRYKKPIILKVKPPPLGGLGIDSKGAELEGLENLLIELVQRGGTASFDPNMEIVITADDLDEDWMLTNSACIISYGSTMCFKAIQAGVPTVIVREMGNVANFEDYFGTVSLEDNFFDIIDKWGETSKEQSDFLESTLRGSIEFNSTDLYVESVYGVINEWKQKNTNQ